MTIYVTLTICAREVVFSVAKCQECGRRIMTLPGTPAMYVRTVTGPTGRGRIVQCPRCHALQEVVEHGERGAA